MRTLWASAIASTVFFVSGLSSSVSAINLYDGTGAPSDQGILQLGSISSAGLPVASSENLLGAGAGVQVNTLGLFGTAEYSGYSNFNPLSSTFFRPSIFNSGTLNRATGYSIDFKFRLDNVGSEVDNKDPRAVFSVLVVSSDNFAVELGFRANEIFSQSSNFTAEENSAAFTTNTLKDYRLTVLGNNYSLGEVTAPMTVNEILSGLLLRYVFVPADSIPPLPFNPYTTPSFIFFGDSSGQASGEFTLGSVDLTPIPFDFSPTGGLLTLGAIAGARHIRKKLKEKSKT